MPVFQPKWIVLILVSFFSIATGQNSFQVAFWNVENLFDTTNSAAIQDQDFTPTGRYEWTEDRLLKKLHDLSQVIKDLDKSNDLAILGLAEIENYEILERLNADFLGNRLEIVHKESPDERGIDCALLYDPQKLDLIQANFIPIYLGGGEKTRDIVEAEFSLGKRSKHSLYVFVNHWPSHWGGSLETDPLRRTTASTLRTRIDEILTKDSKADIIIMGDFNDKPDMPSIQENLRAVKMSPNAYPGDLVNTMWSLYNDPNAGTYMYRGEWGVIDQIIISQGMLDRTGFSWVFNSSAPFRPDYLIESEGQYAGWPYRMYRSGKYHGGYSDHLPITCSVTLAPF